MSSGKTHAFGSAMATPFVLLSTLAATNIEMALVAAFGCAAVGLIITPDLDQEGKSWIENKMMRNQNILVALFGWIHFIIWYPYAKAIPHRHFLSHFPVVGTVVRASYLLALLFVPYWYMTKELGWHWAINRQLVVDYGIALFYGLAVSDAVHYIFDIVSSWRRKQKKRGDAFMERVWKGFRREAWQ